MSATELPTAPVAPPSRRTSILPATIVLAVAVATLASFIVVDLVVTPSVQRAPSPPIVLGGLRLDPHTTVFGGAIQAGEPPGNVATGLVAPVGALWRADVLTGGSPSDYDLEWRLSVEAARPVLLGFYEANLEARGFDLFSKGVAPNGLGDELLFQKAGSDGNEWEEGIVATPTVARWTTYTVRLFVVDDTD